MVRAECFMMAVNSTSACNRTAPLLVNADTSMTAGPRAAVAEWLGVGQRLRRPPLIRADAMKTFVETLAFIYVSVLSSSYLCGHSLI